MTHLIIWFLQKVKSTLFGRKWWNSCDLQEMASLCYMTCEMTGKWDVMTFVPKKGDAITISFHFNESGCEYEGYQGPLRGEMKWNKANPPLSHTSDSGFSSCRYNWRKLRVRLKARLFFIGVQQHPIEESVSQLELSALIGQQVVTHRLFGSLSLLKNAAHVGTRVKISSHTILLNAESRLIEGKVVDLKSLCWSSKPHHLGTIRNEA